MEDSRVPALKLVNRRSHARFPAAGLALNHQYSCLTSLNHQERSQDSGYTVPTTKNAEILVILSCCFSLCNKSLASSMARA